MARDTHTHSHILTYIVLTGFGLENSNNFDDKNDFLTLKKLPYNLIAKMNLRLSSWDW